MLCYLLFEFQQLRKQKKAEVHQIFDASALVPQAGIEPAHLTVHDFESCASTSSATKANPIKACDDRIANMGKL